MGNQNDAAYWGNNMQQDVFPVGSELARRLGMGLFENGAEAMLERIPDPRAGRESRMLKLWRVCKKSELSRKGVHKVLRIPEHIFHEVESNACALACEARPG